MRGNDEDVRALEHDIDVVEDPQEEEEGSNGSINYGEEPVEGCHNHGDDEGDEDEGQGGHNDTAGGVGQLALYSKDGKNEDASSSKNEDDGDCFDIVKDGDHPKHNTLKDCEESEEDDVDGAVEAERDVEHQRKDKEHREEDGDPH